MLQYFVGKLFGDLPPNFNFIIGKKVEYKIKIGYYEIYEGFNKNNEEVSIFIYDKKSKEKNSIKRYITNHFNYSKKLIHPNILKVLYTYENDKRIYIVTEKCIPLIYEKIKSDPLWGIYEIINAVHFINTYNYIHCLINPLSVFVNSRGRWKLSLFDCIHEKNSSINNILNDIRDHLFYDYGFKLKFQNHIHSTNIDAYGLIILMIWSYKNYVSSTLCVDCSFSLDVKNDNTNNNSNIINNKISFNNYNKNSFLDDINNQDAYDLGENIFNIDVKNSKNCIPKNLHIIYDILSNYSSKEIDFNNIINSDNLKNNNIVNIMLFLTELHMKSKIEKNYFLEELFNNLDKISVDIKFQMILPELVQNIEISENVCNCLKIILNISKDLSPYDFQKFVYTTFVKYFSLTDRSIRYVLLENFHLIEKQLDSNNVNEIYEAYTYGFLDNNMSIKNESIKNFIYIFPKLKKSLRPSSINLLIGNLKENDCCIRTNTIICIAKISKYILEDKQNILENVYQIGLQDSFMQTRTATLQSIKFTYDQFSTRKFVSNILPLLISSLIDNNVNVRMYAFDALDHVLVQLRKDLLENCKNDNNNLADSIKTYKFMDKIKDIIKNKCESNTEINKKDDNSSIYKISEQKNSLNLNDLVDVNSNYDVNNNIDNDKNTNEINESIIDNNILLSNRNSKNNVSQTYSSEKNVTNKIVKNDFVTQKKLTNNYNYKNNMIGKQKSYCNINNKDLININVTELNEQKLLPNFQRNIEFNTIDKKLKKKVDIDIDDFFNEFDLKKENDNSKVKLSSLL
ncbi:protein kinase, putative [Plasmodium gallinaceum]|uniref:Protein kinase, putative n=1 Tax=Plasmodium gallinaceum TaxID=5849 RepID=A0A1J1GZ24_PLAGA|nr:protein kinase, putative [Plasmodium gallinaceum]CRG97813.1 protein kinase, putative [Plasmodium gallinaceum]